METRPSKHKPLMLVKREDGKVVIIVGNVQATSQVFNNFEDAEEYLSTYTYEMVINLVSILLYYEKIDKKQDEKVVEKNA